MTEWRVVVVCSKIRDWLDSCTAVHAIRAEVGLVLVLVCKVVDFVI